MKKIIISVLTASFLAALLGVAAYYNGAGYVVFSFSEYTVETSFVFMVGFMAISFFVFYYLIRLLSIVLYFPDYINKKHSTRKIERSKNSLLKGLIEMSEGRFDQAEKMLIKQIDASDTSLLNYLMAARSAQQLEAYDRRDEYLRLAHEVTPSADMAIGLTQAELQLEHQQLEQALATLNHLSGVSPKHGYVKKLQAKVYRSLGDWDSLAAILEDLRKLKSRDDEQLLIDEIDAFYGMIQNSIKQGNNDKVKNVWQQIPKRLNTNVKLIRIYSQYLYIQEQHDEAEILLKNYLSDKWSDELALLYADIKVTDCKKSLETAETWLHNQPRNSILFLVLGKLCLNCELWGKARSYFETSITIKPSAQAYLQLAKLLEDRMDDVNEAQNMYRKGLVVAEGGDKENVHILAEKLDKPLLKVIS